MGSIVRVVVADDHTMMRQGLSSILQSYEDVEVVGQAADGEEAVAAVSRLQPQVVVMDIHMPKMNGIEATALLKARHPDIIVIGLSVSADKENEQAMLNAGAAGLLNKESAVDHLYDAIRHRVDSHHVVPSCAASPTPTIVLLIDGHKEDREYWAQRLHISSPDFVVLEADTGETGLEICKSQHVDCVVVEAELPDMSGFKVLLSSIGNFIRQEKPVIILSRLNVESLKELAIQNGAFAYLMKAHASGDDLDRTIHKALARVGHTRKEPF
jgi:DNA-binding NarL/FixJ family response regulator